MPLIPEDENKKQPGTPKRSTASATDDTLHQLAFDNSMQANIITRAGTGKIIMANHAACKLLGYSKKELLTKTRATIFDIRESGFKKMLKQRTADGHSIAVVTAIKKNGEQLPCEITSAVFTGGNGIEKAITTIADMSQSILKQKELDTKNKKIVAGNIVLARSKQKKIDIKKKKIVAHDILLAQAKADAGITQNNKWIEYIAKASYDVMWDWDIVTGKVYIGDSIEEVFGYKLKDNTVDFTDLKEGFLVRGKNTVVEKLMTVLASRKKNWNDTYKMKRRDGSVASVISRASIVRDETGKAIRMIGATQDVSRLHDLEKRLNEQVSIHEEDSAKFLMAAKLSFDVIWDWNILTNEVFLGDGFEELFGYRIENNKGDMITDWVSHIHPYDRETVIKELQNNIRSSANHWEKAYRVSRADGSIAKVYVRASIIRHADGKAYRMIGAMQDLSRQKELEEKLEQEITTNGKLLREYGEHFKLIFNSSSDVFYDVDLAINEVLISDAYEKEFGYKITSHMTPSEGWVRHIHPGDKKAVIQDYARALASGDTEWKYSYRFLRADNSVANVISNRIILRDADGNAYRILGSMHDISKQKVLEEKLELEIRLKEKQIADATEEAKDTERSDIGKELHDNINQLLGASRMYLDMAKRGGENSKMYLNRSSDYTLEAIEEIRKLTRGLTTDIIKNLGLCDAIDNLARDTMEANPVRIYCTLESFAEQSVNNKFKLNIFRIVQEELNNILKHAKATRVIINLSQNKKFIVLSVSDNGVGFDTGKRRIGIGLDNIKSRAASYKGTADFISQPGRGCALTVKFPMSDMLLNKN